MTIVYEFRRRRHRRVLSSFVSSGFNKRICLEGAGEMTKMIKRYVATDRQEY